jgi:hypothetical protein
MEKNLVGEGVQKRQQIKRPLDQKGDLLKRNVVNVILFT